jgi:hypothetical protein
VPQYLILKDSSIFTPRVVGLPKDNQNVQLLFLYKPIYYILIFVMGAKSVFCKVETKILYMVYIYIFIYLLTAIELSPGGSTHLHTNNTHNNTNNNRTTQITNNVEECEPCPVFASFNLAFALQLRKKHGKTTVRVRQTSVRLIKTSVRVQYTYVSFSLKIVKLCLQNILCRVQCEDAIIACLLSYPKNFAVLKIT